MTKIKYTLAAGRMIEANGKGLMTLNHVTYNGVPALSPSDADIFAHIIINALNHLELMRQQKLREK